MTNIPPPPPLNRRINDSSPQWVRGQALMAAARIVAASSHLNEDDALGIAQDFEQYIATGEVDE